MKPAELLRMCFEEAGFDVTIKGDEVTVHIRTSWRDLDKEREGKAWDLMISLGTIIFRVKPEGIWKWPHVYHLFEPLFRLEDPDCFKKVVQLVQDRWDRSMVKVPEDLPEYRRRNRGETT